RCQQRQSDGPGVASGRVQPRRRLRSNWRLCLPWQQSARPRRRVSVRGLLQRLGAKFAAQSRSSGQPAAVGGPGGAGRPDLVWGGQQRRTAPSPPPPPPPPHPPPPPPPP